MSKGSGSLEKNPLLPLPETMTLLRPKCCTSEIHGLNTPSVFNKQGQNGLLFHKGITNVPFAFSVSILPKQFAIYLGGGTNQFKSRPQNCNNASTASVPCTHHLELNLLHLLFKCDTNLSTVYEPHLESRDLNTS